MKKQSKPKALTKSPTQTNTTVVSALEERIIKVSSEEIHKLIDQFENAGYNDASKVILWMLLEDMNSVLCSIVDREDKYLTQA